MEDNKHSITDHLGIHSYPAFVVIRSSGEITGSYNSFSHIR